MVNGRCSANPEVGESGSMAILTSLAQADFALTSAKLTCKHGQGMKPNYRVLMERNMRSRRRREGKSDDGFSKMFRPKLLPISTYLDPVLTRRNQLGAPSTVKSEFHFSTTGSSITSFSIVSNGESTKLSINLSDRAFQIVGV